MELRHLRYFVIVAEEQNVTKAATRLHVSQPALSRQIHDLEEELGVELFRRTAKSLALTEAGKIFLNEARLVLLSVDKAVETVRAAAKAERGHLRVGYAPSLTVDFLPKALIAFERTCPGVRVSLHDLSSEECTQKLAVRKLDVALTVQPSIRDLKGLTFEKLVMYTLCCAVATSHPLARKRSIKLSQLAGESFVIYSQEDYPEYLEWFRGLFRAVGIEPKIAGEYDGATGLITAVESGRGIALTTSSMKSLAGPRLAIVPIVPKIPLQMGAIFFNNPSKLVEKFVGTVKQAAAAAKIR